MLMDYIMAYVSDYTFHNTTRIGGDTCDQSQQNIQNAASANYLLTNFRPECPMGDAVQFATSQPSINFTGSHSVGIGGCNIDESSKLQIADISKPKCRISLFERPFATVPYLGRGSSNPELESKLQQGELSNNKKSINPSSEVCYSKYSQTPMLPSLKSTVTNPANLVEGVAAEGWVRGGLPSRELVRDQDYAQTHTKKQYI
jgi:hypothetical protein